MKDRVFLVSTPIATMTLDNGYKPKDFKNGYWVQVINQTANNYRGELHLTGHIYKLLVRSRSKSQKFYFDSIPTLRINYDER